jgi:4-hydroxy-tetrahydrodipicolinate synthase
MVDTSSIEGVICPMVTPFDEKGRIDLGGVRRVVDFLLSKGVAALMVSGTTGEGMLLSLAERKVLCEAVIDQVGGRVPVIAHSGCISTADTIDLTRHAASAGAMAASVIVPYFFTFDQDALLAHFVSVANAAPDLPVFLYAFPGNAKNDISAALLERLTTAAPNIIGIKSSNPDLFRLQEYLQVGGKEFLTSCGVDGLMLPALALGARAQVSGNSNVCPETFCALYDAFTAGDMERARSLQQLVNRIRTVLRDGITPAYFKAGLAMRGVPAGYVRPPMQELTSEQKRQVKQELCALEVI